jgi:hypothetical protein
MWAKPSIALAMGNAERNLELDMTDPRTAHFVKGSAADLTALQPPFFVVARGADNSILLATHFEKEPPPGEALTIKSNGDDFNSVVHLDQLPPSPDC